MEEKRKALEQRRKQLRNKAGAIKAIRWIQLKKVCLRIVFGVIAGLVSLQGVTAASSGTHTRWCRKQTSSLALSGAPVCGSEKLPEGSRRDTGGVSVTGLVLGLA